MSAAPQLPPDIIQTPPVRTARAHVSWLSSLQSLLTTITIAVFVITFIVQAFQIPSESMENTLLIGDYLLVDKVHFGTAPALSPAMPYDDIRHDDIIVFRYPVHPDQHFVKRVIGVPGDRIKLVHGVVFVNGKPLDESYVVHKRHNFDPYRDDFPNLRYANPNVTADWYSQLRRMTDERGELIIPERNYFVLGDNRDDSLDSRYWGFVPRENILGRPLMIYFSVNEGDATTANPVQDDKLLRFAYMLDHLTDAVRWKRCLQLVN
jgi:signal peptidase I